MFSASGFESFNGSPDSSQEPATASHDTKQGIDLHLLLFGGESININSGEPHLKIIEEPVEKFRFRYKSEMRGTHGSILARSNEKNRKKTYPSVQLCNYSRPAIVRCSLYTAQDNEKLRTSHTHRLIVRADNMEKDDPHDVVVRKDNNYTAIFQGMCIVHTARKNIVTELLKKKRERLLEKLQATNKNIVSLNIVQESKLQLEAKEEAQRINLNSVSLCFEAFVCENNSLVKICEPVFSKPINNMKSALTGDLKICRIDKSVSSCVGGEEVFILVEKVGKKNISVRFFELNEDGSEKWYAFGKFSELDVHHQYAIVFRTPPYRNVQIEEDVEVFLQLYRPSDGCFSEPRTFRYKPAEKRGRTRKRPKVSKERLLPGDQITSSQNGNNNGTLNLGTELRKEPDTLLEVGSGLMSEIISDDLMNSPQFCEFTQNLNFEEYFKTFDNPLECEYDGGEIKKSTNITTLMIPIDELKTEKEIEPDIERKEITGDNDLLQKALLQLHMVLQEKCYFQACVTSKQIEEIFNMKNKEGDTVLHTGVMTGWKDTMKLMLQGGEGNADLINSQNFNSETPLHLAVLYNQLEFIKMLLTKGADINVVNNDGNSPLHLAVCCAHDECLIELLDKRNYVHNNHKPKCDEKNYNGQTPLHLCAVKGNLFGVKHLVGSGANVNTVDSTLGRHMLILAVEEGRKEMVEYLLKKTNVKVNLSNYTGNTALHYACVANGGNAEICKLLIDAGADPLKTNHEQSNKPISAPSKISGMTIKEEVRCEDELHLLINDGEEDDDDADTSKGHTSMDLARNNKEILEILKKANQGMTSSLQNQGSDDVKIEEICLMSKKSPFDHFTLTKTMDSLKKRNWANYVPFLIIKKHEANLADQLDYTFLVIHIKNTTSPPKLLF